MAKTSPASDSPATPALNGDAEPDWEVRATQKIVETVEKIREQTSGRAITIAGYVLFGAAAISLGTVALIILVVLAVRALNAYLPDAVFGETHMWAAHLITGLILFLAGLVLYLTKARRRPQA